MFSKAFLALAFASTAFAGVFVTSPTQTTTFQAGQQATISWQDDGKAPSLSSFGPSKISIYVGNSLQQTSLQLINGNVDVSQSSSITFTPDPSIGPNSNQYFIRFESLSLIDNSVQPPIPALSFSHQFTLAGMTGTFSPAVSAQIAGQSTAPIGGAVATSAGPASTGGSPSAPANPTSANSTSKKATSTSSSAPTSSHSSSAMSIHVGWAGAFLSALVGMTVL
ncbi:hypothetical protein JR316_0013239 [Psilocybe cubensis]|uniref:Yeast cell wall synthesis Kre9/Knh1-like N-terminal domain-containing protein n=2 Tax=Psilocybe cubensis TaxID=181762 RepID=A0A8H7XQE3_PSICU|nr:hypothetical protein JR316_0013239 [Psilocybe cubensis]KAH9474774.1 hypothetical protein JR316_0013239 [Psilocybe cubensis]